MLRGLFLFLTTLLLGLLALVTSLFFLFRFFLGQGRMRWFTTWRELATRYRGLVDSCWWLPRMRMQWRGQPVVLTSQKRYDGQRLQGTVLESSAPELEGAWWIESRDWANPPGPAPRRQRKQGNQTATAPAPLSGFDESFVVTTPQGTRSLPELPDAIRWQLLELLRWSGSAPLQIRVEPRRIRIARPGYLKTPAELDDFLRLGLRVIDQFRTMRTSGLEFVNEDQATVLDETFCPICTDRIEGRTVICVRCKTPHCRDCWEYNGKCGMFACNETRYTAVGRN